MHGQSVGWVTETSWVSELPEIHTSQLNWDPSWSCNHAVVAGGKACVMNEDLENLVAPFLNVDVTSSYMCVMENWVFSLCHMAWLSETVGLRMLPFMCILYVNVFHCRAYWHSAFFCHSPAAITGLQQWSLSPAPLLSLVCHHTTALRGWHWTELNKSNVHPSPSRILLGRTSSTGKRLLIYLFQLFDFKIVCACVQACERQLCFWQHLWEYLWPHCALSGAPMQRVGIAPQDFM